MARRHLSRNDARGIAEERVDRLFELAEEAGLAGNDERARRYVGLALKMNERHKVRARHKRRYCPACHVFFTPPRNVRVRIGSGNVAMTCLSCGNVLRYPLKPKKV